MTAITIIAATLGYLVLALLIVSLTVWAGLLTWAHFPAKHCWARGPKLIGRLVTNDRLDGQNLNLLVGIQSRGKPRWFLGLMLLDSTGQPPRWPRIITRKDAA